MVRSTGGWCSNLFPVGIETLTGSILVRKGFTSVIEGTQAEPLEERCLLAHSLQVHAQLTLYSPSPPAQGWWHPQGARPSHIKTQDYHRHGHR